MTREDPQLKIRLPADLKLQISEWAVHNGRSLNAEIVTRLKDSLEPPQMSGDDFPSEDILIRISQDAAQKAVTEVSDRLSKEISRLLEALNKKLIP